MEFIVLFAGAGFASPKSSPINGALDTDTGLLGGLTETASGVWNTGSGVASGNRIAVGETLKTPFLSVKKVIDQHSLSLSPAIGKHKSSI